LEYDKSKLHALEASTKDFVEVVLTHPSTVNSSHQVVSKSHTLIQFQSFQSIFIYQPRIHHVIHEFHAHMIVALSSLLFESYAIVQVQDSNQ